MRSRRRRARAIAWPLAAVVALTAPAADAQSIDGFPDSRFIEQRERFTPDDGVPIDLRFLIAREAAGQTTRVVNTTHAALTMLSAWFGPLAPSLTVAGVPWRGPITGEARPGLVSAPLRWLSPVRDQSTERALVSALVRQYWSRAATQAPAPSFEDAVIIYTAARAVHQLLEVSNFQTTRFFGGVVPFPLRSVLLSPPAADPRPRLWKFDEFEPAVGDEVRRTVKALQTLERYVGWPTQLEALSRMRVAEPQRHDADAFATALSEVRGTDMRPLVMECLRADAVFDYSLDGLRSEPGAAGLIETTVTITRRGTGRFEIDNEADERDATIPLVVRFADGTEVRDYFDGAAPSVTLVYSTKAGAVSATIDPDVMLLIDVNRENNAIIREAPLAPLGLRLALHWMAWLQNAMLSYTSLV